MKKMYALLLLAAGTILSATAQPFVKGDKLLGGSISFTKAKNLYNSPGFESTGFNISPSVGFFVKPNRLIGFSLNYAHGKTNDYKTDGFGASIYKQYWSSLGKNFYYITEGNLSGNYSHTKAISIAVDYDYTKSLLTAFFINPGLAYRINKRLVINVLFTNFLYTNYLHINTKRKYATPQQPIEYNQSQFSVGTGFSDFTINSLQFGFRFVL